MKNNQEQTFNYGEWFNNQQQDIKSFDIISDINIKKPKEDTIESLTEEFYVCLTEAVKSTTEWVRKLSGILFKIKTLKGDISFAKKYLGGLLVDIADGKLSADVASDFWGNTPLLKAISKFDVDVQKQLVNKKKINLVLKKGDGSFDVKEKEINELDVSEIKQVFGEKKIKTVSEQKDSIVSKPLRNLKRSPVTPRFTTQGNYKKGNTFGRVGDEYITIEDVFKALADKYNVSVKQIKVALKGITK